MKNLEKNSIEHEKLENINFTINIEDNTRQFGFAKGTFTYISDDFDKPLEEFKAYIP